MSNPFRAVLLGQEKHDSPEWHALRTGGIGGSEVAAIVGLSPWESRFSLYHRKRGELGDKGTNPGMSWGTRLEPVICDVFAEEHREYAAIAAGTYRHHERVWQRANVDRLLFPVDDWFGQDTPDPVALLEAKTAHQYDAFEWGKPGTDEIPPYYRCQVLWYMDALELPAAHLAVLIGGSDYREYEIPYAEDEAAWLRAQAEEFWQEVTDGTAPPIDGSEHTYEAVRELHPQINGEDVDLDPAVYDTYLTTKATAEEAATAARQAKSALLDHMGEARRGLVAGKPVLRRQPARGGNVALYPIAEPKHQQKTSGDAA